MMKIYATVGDSVVWEPHPKGHNTRMGEKGNWKNIEGPTVISDVEVVGKEDFAAKETAIKLLWPASVIRFMPDKKA